MEAFKVGVSLVLTSNHHKVLTALSSGLLHVHTRIKDLEKGFANLGAVIGGALAIKAGMGILHTMEGLMESAKELNHEMTQLNKFNIPEADIAAVKAEAIKVVRDIKGVTETQALAAYGNAYGMMGHANALKVMGPSARFAEVAGNTAHGDYKGAYESLYSMLRSGELQGAFINQKTHAVDVDRLNRFLELGSKVMLGTHGRVDAQQWLNMAQQGAPALSGMSDRGLIEMSIMAQAMGGSRAGTALMSTFQQFQGGRMTKRVGDALYNAGIITDYEKTGPSSVYVGPDKYTDPNTLTNLRESPRKFIGGIMGAMADAGLNREEMAMQVFEIFGRQTTQRAAHDFIRNFEQIGAETERIEGGMGLGKAKDYQDKHDITQAEHNLDAAWKGLKLAFAGPSAPAIVAFINRLTGAIEAFTIVVRQTPPETIQAIAMAIGKLAVGLIAGGGLAIGMALGTTGALVAGAVLLAIRLADVDWKAEWDKFTSDIKALSAWLDGADAKFKAWQASVGETLAQWVSDSEAALERGRSGMLEKISGVGITLEDWMSGINEKWEAMKVAGYAGIAKAAAAVLDGFASMPERLTVAIQEMGTALVSALGDKIRALGSLLHKSAAEGGAGFGGLIHNASFGGGGPGYGQPGFAGYASTVTGTKSERAMKMIAMLRGMGWSQAGAASAAAQALTESQFDPTAIGDKKLGPGREAHGLFQWRESRWQALQAFAAREGKHWSDFDTQVRFFNYEVGQKADKLGLHGWKTATNPAAASGTYGYRFEGYGGPPQAHRGRDAQALFEVYRDAARTPPPRKTPPVEVDTTVKLDGRRVSADKQYEARRSVPAHSMAA